MRRVLNLLGWCLFVGTLVAPALSIAGTPLERGRYLVRSIAGCGNCHTMRGPDGKPVASMELAGGNEFDIPIAHVVTPNITPDEETGIGRWTDDQIVAALREGKRADGTMIGPIMPIAFYRQISDDDITAIVAYLRSIPPVRHQVARTTYTIPLPQSYGPPVTAVANVPRDDHVAYGAYLTGPVGHCLECHTPFVQGQLDMTRIGAGGRPLPLLGGNPGIVLSRNITASPTSGLGKWTDHEIKTAITSGVRPDGTRLVPTMGFAWYANIDDGDLGAIVAYLRTLKPVETP
jgi:mono/diheme cytochrome c family protein